MAVSGMSQLASVAGPLGVCKAGHWLGRMTYTRLSTYISSKNPLFRSPLNSNSRFIRMYCSFVNDLKKLNLTPLVNPLVRPRYLGL